MKSVVPNKNVLHLLTNGVSMPFLRSFSSRSSLTHTNESGKARMVDVSQKSDTERVAVARGKVLLGPLAYTLVLENKMKKGDVLAVAQIAGINAAKQTGYLIPLCHPLLLHSIKVDLQLEEGDQSLVITSTVKCNGKTGVEMEAIMAVSVAACTVYDMCKAVDKGIVIQSISLVSKSGGKSGFYSNQVDAIGVV